MISWSIRAAHQSECFDKIIVSTDDDEIAEISRKEGAETPFKRPSEIANDYASTREVIEHSVKWLIANNIKHKYICCLYATAPFVMHKDIKKGFELMGKTKDDNFVFTCTSFEYPIQRALSINSNGISKMIIPENYPKRSQDLEETYHDAGQFYIGSRKAWLENDNFFENGTPLIIPRWRVQDIDTMEDWIRAENIHKLIFN